MHSLIILEIDISHWDPYPGTNSQRARVLEARMFCPTLRAIVIGTPGGARYVWRLIEDAETWIQEPDRGQKFWSMV